MTYTQQILEKYPTATEWHQEYPWFATGHLVAAAASKDTAAFDVLAQRAAIHINTIPRLHWLLHQPEWDKADLLTSLQPKVDSHPLIGADHPSEIAAPQPSFTIDLSGPPDAEEPPMGEEEEMTESKSTPVSGLLAQAANSFKSDAPAQDALLYETALQHTVDYFASQGIKLEGEPAHDDRFGQQLKTFTSWLRQMKRLPNTPELDADPLVETHAAHSLQQGDVTTESMVDILVKQGKKGQAIELLEKLRLLHPEKSLYFAARSEQIKHLK